METPKAVEVANLCTAGIKGYNEMNGRIYAADGVATTVRANSGGHNEIKVAIPQATKQGYIECEMGGVVDLSYPNSKTRRGRVQMGGSVSPTITAESNGLCRIEPRIGAVRGRNKTTEDFQQTLEVGGDCSNSLTTVQKDNVVIEPSIRVRKLTPRENWRLMGFDDADFDKAAEVNSSTQLYKQAGNSIVVDVLMAIFDQML